MRRRHSILETIMPVEKEFTELAGKWLPDASTRMLEWIWEGHDLLMREIMVLVDWSLAEDDLEREITELLEIRIRRSMPDAAPMYVQHEKKERETREPAPAQPPEYDIAFVLYANERIMWPIEAKILKTDQHVAAYVRDLKNEFLTCRYAPFSREGAMMGYLFSGKPHSAFDKIARDLDTKLYRHPDFSNQNHRVSVHFRIVPTDKSYPAYFQCHHLLMKLKQQ